MTKIKRIYSLEDLKNTNNRMMNYVVQLKVYGCTKGTMKIHIGIKGNHLQIIKKIVNEEYGKYAVVTGAKVTGRVWS